MGDVEGYLRLLHRFAQSPALVIGELEPQPRLLHIVGSGDHLVGRSTAVGEVGVNLLKPLTRSIERHPGRCPRAGHVRAARIEGSLQRAACLAQCVSLDGAVTHRLSMA